MNLSQRKDVCQNKILLMSLNHFQLLWLQEMGLPPLKTSEEIVHDERCNHEHVCPQRWSRCPGFHRIFNGLPGCSYGLLSLLSSWQRHLTFQEWSSNFRRKEAITGERRCVGRQISEHWFNNDGGNRREPSHTETEAVMDIWAGFGLVLVKAASQRRKQPRASNNSGTD